MSGGYIGLIWMDTDGELMKPVLWIQLRALSLSLSFFLSLSLSQHYCFTRRFLNAKGKLLLLFFVPTDCAA
jgi:hypothetical protein